MLTITAKCQLICEDLHTTYGLMKAVVGASDFLEWLKEIFADILPLIMGCFAGPKEAVAAMQDPNWFQEMRLNAFLRRRMDTKTERRLLGPLKASVLKLGKTITEDEYNLMQQELLAA